MRSLAWTIGCRVDVGLSGLANCRREFDGRARRTTAAGFESWTVTKNISANVFRFHHREGQSGVCRRRGLAPRDKSRLAHCFSHDVTSLWREIGKVFFQLGQSLNLHFLVLSHLARLFFCVLDDLRQTIFQFRCLTGQSAQFAIFR